MKVVGFLLLCTWYVESNTNSAQKLDHRVGIQMNKNSKIYVAGHTGLVGTALVSLLREKGYYNLILKTHQELDLRDQNAVNQFFAQEQPEYVFLLAARVGGIKANMTFPAQFIYDNLMITSNVIHAAYTHNVKKLLFLGSSCIYPRDCAQPIKEEYLLSGPLEQTNAPYALAKIAGLELCASYFRQYGAQFISCMPTNLYGPHDNFDAEQSHVIPGLIKKIYQAHINNESHVALWGTGKVKREFLFAPDCARGLLFLMQNYTEMQHINLGSGFECSIEQLAHSIKEIIGYRGTILFNNAVADGTPRKLLDCSKLEQLGWCARTNIYEGLQTTIAWYIQQQVLTSAQIIREKRI